MYGSHGYQIDIYVSGEEDLLNKIQILILNFLKLHFILNFLFWALFPFKDLATVYCDIERNAVLSVT
jgi:nitrate reductase gamma subunit